MQLSQAASYYILLPIALLKIEIGLKIAEIFIVKGK